MMINIEKVDSVPHLDLGKSEAEAMTFCVRISAELWHGTIDGQTACVWGLIPPSLLSTQAYLWLHTTELVNGHQFIFVRYSQRMVEILLNEYDSIIGHVRVDSPRSIRWLKWLGADIGEPTGAALPFSIKKKERLHG